MVALIKIEYLFLVFSIYNKYIHQNIPLQIGLQQAFLLLSYTYILYTLPYFSFLKMQLPDSDMLFFKWPLYIHIIYLYTILYNWKKAIKF